MNNEAILAAIEQAKQALDQIEAECAAKKPEEMPEEPGESGESEGGPPMPPMPMRKPPMAE